MKSDSRLGFAKRTVRCPLPFEKRALQSALRRVSRDTLRCHVQAAIHIGLDAARYACDVPDRIALIRSGAVAIEIERNHRVAVGIGNEQNLAVGRDRDAVGPRLPLRENVEIAFGRDMPDAVEVEFAVVVRAAKRGIGEVHMPVFAHHNVIRRVEFLALEALGHGLDLSLQVEPRDAPVFRFAHVQTPLRIVRKPGYPSIVVSQNRWTRVGADLENRSLPHIRDREKTHVRPGKPVDKSQMFSDLLRLVVERILQGKRSSQGLAS